MTKRVELEEWLDNLRSEVEDIVNYIKDYLKSCANQPPSVKGEFSVLASEVGEVDDKDSRNSNRLMIRKWSTPHRS